MPVLRLEPTSTVAVEFGDCTVVGAATAHEALSDASDASYCNIQVSSFEPAKWFRGNLTDLPEGAGAVVGVIINVRAAFSPAGGNGRLESGEYPNPRLTNTLTGTITDYATSSLTLWPEPATVNGLQYMAGVNFVSGGLPGPVLRIYKMNFDVDFNYINGVSVAMIFQYLGPIIALGLHEMPKLQKYLFENFKLRLHPHEVIQVWRDVCAAKHRRYSF